MINMEVTTIVQVQVNGQDCGSGSVVVFWLHVFNGAPRFSKVVGEGVKQRNLMIPGLLVLEAVVMEAASIETSKSAVGVIFTGDIRSFVLTML